MRATLLRCVVSTSDDEHADLVLLAEGQEIDVESRTHHPELWGRLVVGHDYDVDLQFSPWPERRGQLRRISPDADATPRVDRVSDTGTSLTGPVTALEPFTMSAGVGAVDVASVRVLLHVGLAGAIALEVLPPQVADLRPGDVVTVDGVLSGWLDEDAILFR